MTHSDHKNNPADELDAWKHSRKGAYVGVLLGVNSWWLGFALLALLYGELSSIVFPLSILMAWSVAASVLLLCVLELYVVRLGSRVLVLPICAMVSFVAGSALLLYDAFVLPALERVPELLARLDALGAVVHVPHWVGVALLLASALLLAVVLRRVRVP